MLNLLMRKIVLLFLLFTLAYFANAQNNIITPETNTLQMYYLRPYKSISKVIVENNGKERDLGMLIDELKIIEKDGEKYYERVQQMPTIGLIDTSIDKCDNLAPVFHAGHNSSGYMHLNFGKSEVTGEKYFSKNDSLYIINNNMPGSYFDSNMFEVVLRLLPLKENYEVSVPYYIFESGGYVLYKVKVTGEDELKTGNDEMKDVWVLEAKDNESATTFYITKETREVIKMISIRSPQLKIISTKID